MKNLALLRSESSPSAKGPAGLATAVRSTLARPGVILTCLFVLSLPLVTPYLRGDGVGYYAWLRSPVIDRDMQFENEYRHGDPAFIANTFDEQGRVKPEMRTQTGRVRNQWSVGAALLWTPFFLVAHGLILLGRSAGMGWAADGFALPYRWAAALGTALYAFLGLLLAYRIARRFSEKGPALLGTLAVWGASSLLIYQYFLPFWPFGAGAFLAAALLVLWHRERTWGLRRWALMGLVSGLLVSVHPVAVTWLALPALSLAGFDPGRLADRLRAGGVFIFGGALGLAPQLAAKAVVHGSPFDTGYQAAWRPLHPDILRVLFGAEHGLIVWTPIAAFAIAGLALVVVRRDRRLGIGLLSVLVVMAYLIAAYATPEQSSFGNRFFVLFTPGFVIGTVALSDRMWSRRKKFTLAVAGLLVVWNVLLAFQWAWGMIPKRGPVDWGEVTRNQFTAAPREFAHAARLFVTDRGALVRTVEQADLENLQSGRDRSTR